MVHKAERLTVNAVLVTNVVFVVEVIAVVHTVRNVFSWRPFTLSAITVSRDPSRRTASEESLKSSRGRYEALRFLFPVQAAAAFAVKNGK